MNKKEGIEVSMMKLKQTKVVVNVSVEIGCLGFQQAFLINFTYKLCQAQCKQKDSTVNILKIDPIIKWILIQIN